MTRRENFELLHSRALERLSNDREAFADYLIYSARFFKLDVSQVVALFEDNPNATMVADEQTWRSFGRVIKKNGWATEVMISDGENKPNGFKKLYDISMTDSKEPKPFQWTFDKELAESFVKKTSQSERRDFDRVSDCLDYLATNAAVEQYETFQTEINVPKDREDVFKKSYMSMVRRVVAARCEMNSNFNYISSADAEVNLQALDCISGTKDLENLIEQVHSAASKVLWSMEKSISNINIERSVIYDRNRGTEGLDRGGSSSDRRGSSPSVVRGGREVLSVAENAQEPSVSAEREAVHLRDGNVHSGLDTAGGGADARTDKRVRENVAELYEGEPPVRHTDPTDERAVGVNPAQDRPDSSGYVRHDERGISEDSSRTRPQRYESDIHLVGATDELSQGEDIQGTSVREVDSGRLGGVDEQVSNNNNETAELENSAVDLSENHVTSSLSVGEKSLVKPVEKSFSEQVDDALNGNIPFYSSLKVCDTPSILLAVGCKQLPMLFTQRHLKQAITPKSDNNIHLHGLTIEQVKALPQLIANPIIIYDSLSRDDSIVAVTSEVDGDGLPIIISIVPNGEGRYEMQTLNSNFITSVHGRNDISYQIRNAIKFDKMLFWDKVKSQALFERWGLPLPELTNALDSINIIHQSRNIVKGEIEKNQNFFDNHERKQQSATNSTVHFGLLGNGITVYDTSKTDPKADDYLTIAHISDEGNIKYYVDTHTINAEDITRIITQANEQKAKFTEQWNALTNYERYQRICDGANALPAPNWDIFAADKNIMLVEEIIKKYEHPIIFHDSDFPQAERIVTAYRVGDFYEIYGDVAYTAADLLNLTLTSRQDVPMVGFPAHAYNQYKRDFAARGYYVAQGDERDIDEVLYSYSQEHNTLDEYIANGITERIYEDGASLDLSDPETLKAIEITDKTRTYYSDFYENNNFERTAVDVGEAFLKDEKNADFIKKVVKLNKDAYSSDRELAAFAYALEDFGMVEKFSARLDNIDLYQLDKANYQHNIDAGKTLIEVPIMRSDALITRLAAGSPFALHYNASQYDLWLVSDGTIEGSQIRLYAPNNVFNAVELDVLTPDERTILNNVVEKCADKLKEHLLNIGDINEIDDPDYYEEQQLAEQEAREEALEQESKLIKAVRGGAVAKIEEKPSDVSSSIPIENARANKISNIRLVYNDDSGFHLIADTDKVNDAVITVFGQNELEVRDYLNENAVSTTIERGENGVTYNTESAESKAEEEEPVQSAEFSDNEPEYEQQSVFDMDTEREDIETPVEINNLAQLKRALTIGAEFEITSYIHTDTVNQLRRVNYVDTTGIYSIRPDKPDDEVSVANGGRGYYLQWGHASEWEFSNGNCTVYRFDTEHTPENALMSVRVKPRIIEKTTKLRDETEHEAQGEPVKLKDLVIDLTPRSEREELRIDPPVEKHNFTITDEHLGEGGAKAKFNANVEAIRTLQKIESENRLATPAEQEVLSKYVGWGGIPQAFDVSNQQWAKEYSELKSVLSDDEYAAARHSTMNAHYTSPTVIEAIYSALDRFGIKGGNVLEPAMGIGNFFGVMPEQMRANSQLFGVELDDITGRIAKQLYQNANIQVCGYENSTLSDNFFDVAIGNVPFGDYGVADTRYNRENFLIHDYFFAKTLDKVAPNGIVAFITSKGTLDKASPKVREYLAKRADLIGAIRLPNNAFKANAGTEVTSDIIFLQKREKMAVEMPDWVYTAPNEDGININQYFVNHPEMVLGVMKQGVEYSMHGNPNETACVPVEGANLREQLQVAVKMLERDVVTETLDKSQDKQAGVIPATSDIHNFTFGIVDGKIYYRENNIMTEERLSDKAAERVRGLIEVRNTFRELLDAQADGSRSDEDISALREKLNSQYDVFAAKYGAISSINNKRVFSKDDTYDHLCGSLEHVNSQTKEISKSDIFTKRTVKPFVEITHVDTPAEGLSVSLDLRGRVDIGYIAELCGQEDNEVINSLIENDLIYKNPETEQYEETAEYLSGYVRDKLLAAQKAAIDNPEYERNVAALNEALPPTIGAEDIYVRIGASWIDNDDYCDFFREYAKGIISTASYSNRAVLSRLPSGEYKIDNKTADTSVAALNSFGTTRMSSYAIFENLLNNRNIAIYDYYEAPDGKRKREFNKDETQLVQEKARQMKEAFPKWLWENAQRRDKYVERYNTLFNSVVGRSFDGSHQVFAGMNPNIELAPHQKDAVMRCKLGGNTLLAHCVGAGKSFEMATAVMEKRRLGLVNKACVVLPKHLVGQMAAEWSRLYPNARLLTAKETDFNKANRRKFIGRCCTGEYDAVLMSYEQFHRIPMSKEYEMSFVQDQIKTLDDAIRDATPKGVYIDAGTRRTIKRLESEKEKLKVKVTKLLSSPRDNSISFEQLGFDCLVVDEAHNYKNGLIVTKMNNVAGLGSSAAAKSVDFLMKTKYLNEKTGERNIILATGTPISNSMTELYILQQYMRPSGLERRGLQNFDDWASTFGEVVSEMSLKPAGNGFQNKNKFAKFCNYDELMLMYHDFADIRNADDLQLPVPEIEGGKPQTVSAKPNEFQKAYVQILAERSEAIHNGVVSDPRVDNMLKITGEARLLGLDARCINPEAENDPNSKVNMLIQKVMEIYTETTEQKGVQAIFCDIAINGGKMPVEITIDSANEETVEENSEPEQGFNAEKLSEAVAPSKFSVYDYIKSELIRRGIPENEICFAGDAKNQSQRNTMYGELRDGQKRIILASTTKLGTGANIQTRLCALHNLDIPWRPSDFEQRQGRIVRQGNTFPTVKIYNYVTEGTFDAYMLDLIVTKQKFISQVMSGKTHARICEDVDESVLNYSEMQAIATGDPRIKEKIELDVEVSRLKLLESEYNKKRYEFDDMETRFKAGLSIAKNKLALALDDKAFAEKNVLPEGEFKIELNGKIYTERKDAGKELRASMMRFLKDKQAITIGEYRGFTISLNWGMVSYGQSGISANLRQGKGLTYTASDLGLDNDIGCITRIENVIKLGIDKQIAAHQSSIENTEKDLEEVERTKALPFEHAAELAEKSARLEQLNNELGVNKADNVVFDETLDENEMERGSETRTAEPEPRKDESIERKPLKKVGIRH